MVLLVEAEDVGQGPASQLRLCIRPFHIVSLNFLKQWHVFYKLPKTQDFLCVFQRKRSSSKLETKNTQLNSFRTTDFPSGTMRRSEAEKEGGRRVVNHQFERDNYLLTKYPIRKNRDYSKKDLP